MISGTKEWAVAEINCCIGCPYDCRYCYARTAALKKGLIDSAEQWTRISCSDSSVPASAKRYRGQVMFPAAHDIVAENLELSIAVVDRLLAAGNRVLIVSKPDRRCIEELCDRFWKQRSQIIFRFTITARDPAVVGFWEPNAPGYGARLKSLKLAFARGFETSVSCEPILDIGDCIEMIEELEPFVSHSIWLGRMNRIDERVAVDSDAAAAEVARIVAQQSDDRIRLLYQSLKSNPLMRWKESIKLVVGLPPAPVSGLDM